MNDIHLAAANNAGKRKGIGQYGHGVFGLDIETLNLAARLKKRLCHPPAMGCDNRAPACGHDGFGHVQCRLFGPAGFKFGYDLQQGKVGREGQVSGP